MILVLLLALATAGDAILAKLYVGAKQESARIEQAFNSFKAQVKVEGEKAALEAKTREMQDKLRKDTADAENAHTIASLNATIGELRHQRDSARRSFLSSTPAGSKCPPEQTCFDRAEFQRTYGGLVKDLRGFADESTAVNTDLDTAKKWAQKN